MGLPMLGTQPDRNEKASRFGSWIRSPKHPSPNPYAQSPQVPAGTYAQEDNNKFAHMGEPAPSPYQPAKQPFDLRTTHAASRAGASTASFGLSTPRSVQRVSPPLNGGQYGAERYGSGGGYGVNRYEVAQPGVGSRYGAGGYGGLGRSNSSDTTVTDDNREALFGDAKKRYAQKEAHLPDHEPLGSAYDAESTTDKGYGYGEQRELTAEEEEEVAVQGTKNKIRETKLESAASTRSALRVAGQAKEDALNTLTMLGIQGEQLYNAEKNSDLTTNKSVASNDKSKDLIRANRSMFAVHVPNPFTTEKRRDARDKEILEKHQADKEERFKTLSGAYQHASRIQKYMKDEVPRTAGQTKSSLTERSKYQFEADAEDDELEDEIDTNLGLLSNDAAQLYMYSKAIGEVVDEQNQHIPKVGAKIERADDNLAVTNARLGRMR